MIDLLCDYPVLSDCFFEVDGTVPSDIPLKLIYQKGIRAFIFDVYGTILKLEVGGTKELLENGRIDKAFFSISNLLFPNKFSFGDFGRSIKDLWIDEAKRVFRKKRNLGIESPEIRVELVWMDVLEKMKKSGLNFKIKTNTYNMAKELAIRFDCLVQKKGFYNGILDLLISLKKEGFMLGILSNAQFYTPIQLKKLFSLKNLNFYEIFERDLVIFSYKFGVSKPNPVLFEILSDRLKAKGILEKDVMFVGNDLRRDIYGAKRCGMRTALFAGDKQCLKNNMKIEPDVVFHKFSQLKEIIL